MKIFLFGGTGFVGRSVCKKLVAEGYELFLYVRDENRARAMLEENKSVVLIEGELSDFKKIREVIDSERIEVVIYLVGIIRETKEAKFAELHYNLPKRIIDLSQKQGINRFVFMSANGVENNAVAYQSTKLKTEMYLKKSGLSFTVVRPSLIVDSTSERAKGFMKDIDNLLKFPIVPLPGGGDFKLSPVELDLVAEKINESLGSSEDEVLKLVGDEVLTFTDIVKKRAGERELKRIFVPVPLFIIKIAAALFDRFSFFPITRDQITMLEQGNY